MTTDNNTLSSGNTLMDLRLCILRTIAEVWEDDQSHNSKGLRKQIEEMSPEQTIRYMHDRFGYQNPFENFSIKFVKGVALWNQYGDNQWTKPQNETFVLSIPGQPHETIDDSVKTGVTKTGVTETDGTKIDETKTEVTSDQYLRAQKLMEFYQHFPNIFGLIKTAPSEYNSENSNDCSANDNNSGINFSGNDYNLGVSEDSFLSFGAVVSKIIANAWQNQTFMQKIDYRRQLIAAKLIDEKDSYNKTINIINNPSQDYNDPINVFNRQYFAEIKELLENHFDFTFPWMFDLAFLVPPAELSFWDTKGNWRSAGPEGNDLIRNFVTLEIPITPTQEDTANVSLALARYNCIGPAYPFTCS